MELDRKMRRYGNNYGFPKYVSVAERRAKAEKKVRQLRKKNPDITPVEIQGQKLARSGWGSSWNKNLEGYADYSNRIGRGRSLFFTLRGVHMEDLVNQAVKDEARDLLTRANRKKSRRILREADISTTFGIHMDDDAAPVASGPVRRPATRKKAAPASKKKTAGPQTASGKIAVTRIPIPGISFPSTAKSKSASPVPRKKKSSEKTVSPPTETAIKAPRAKDRTRASKTVAEKRSDYDVVVGIIRRRRVKGIGFKEIKSRTDINDTKIRNILFQAKKNKAIQNVSRGLYIKGEA